MILTIPKNRLIIASVTCISLMTVACHKKAENSCGTSGHSSFTLNNNSSRKINWAIYWGNYPDTAIGAYNPTGMSSVIAPHRRGDVSALNESPGCLDNLLANGKKEYLYIFDEDSLQGTSWETVRSTEYGLLERREIDLKYLEDNDFQIYYP